MSNSHKEEEFKIVTTKKSKYKGGKKKPNHQNIENPIEEIIDKSIVLRKIEEAKTDICSSKYLLSLLEQLDKVIELLEETTFDSIICFGLGRFSSCLIARFQLAFILLVRDHFKIKTIKFYDPIFLQGEIDILHQLNCETIEENHEGKYNILNDELCLLYLPHCAKQLTNNFLWSNWSLNLSKVILIGNSFTNLITSTIERELQLNANFILRIQNHTEEIEIVNKFKYTDIFNDTSIHAFPKSKLNLLPFEFWEDCKEPEYEIDDTELIKSNKLTEPIR